LLKGGESFFDTNCSNLPVGRQVLTNFLTSVSNLKLTIFAISKVKCLHWLRHLSFKLARCGFLPSAGFASFNWSYSSNKRLFIAK